MVIFCEERSGIMPGMDPKPIPWSRVLLAALAALAVVVVVVVPILAIVWGPRALWFLTLSPRPTPSPAPATALLPCHVDDDCAPCLAPKESICEVGKCVCAGPKDLAQREELRRLLNLSMGVECEPQPRDGGLARCRRVDAGVTKGGGGEPKKGEGP